MTAYDFIFIIPLLYALYSGFTKGFIIQLATVVALILGLVAAYYFSDYVAESFLKKWEMSYRFTHMLAFSITFLVVLAAIYFLAYLLTKVVKIMTLGWLNRLMGVVFSLLKMALVLSTLIYIVDPISSKYKFSTYDKVQQAYLYPFIKPIAPVIFNWIDGKHEEIKEMVPKKSTQKNNKAEWQR